MIVELAVRNYGVDPPHGAHQRALPVETRLNNQITRPEVEAWY
jgi:hypothetical protein